MEKETLQILQILTIQELQRWLNQPANGTKLYEMIQQSVLLLLCGLSQVFEIFICKFLYIKIISLINKK